MTDESSRSATITDVVAVRGGGIPMDAILSQSWILYPEIVAGKRFIDVYTREYRCRNYLGCRFAMVRCLKRQRDATVNKAMHGLASEEDPNSLETMNSTGPLGRPRRELVDRIPQVLEISAETRNGVAATVNVLPTWRERGVLRIELTKENLDLLLEEPPAASAQSVPDVNQPNVTWVAGRNSLRCNYFDSKKKAWRTKSKLMEFDTDMDDEEMQEVTNNVAEAMQDFFDKHHDLQDNRQGNDDSAESAHDERDGGPARGRRKRERK